MFPSKFADIFLTCKTLVTNLHLLRVELPCKFQETPPSGTAEQGGEARAQAPPIIFPRLIEWRLIIISAAFSN